MDACIQSIFSALEARGLLDDTIVVINADHGETLYDHDCYFDHHGLYEPTLHVPLIIRYPGKVAAGKRVAGLQPAAGLDAHAAGSGGHRNRTSPSMAGACCRWRPARSLRIESEFYITECTWMRKHGWRTPEWKLIVALEPDFHFKPAVELYNLIEDPCENHNLAETRPEVVALLRSQWRPGSPSANEKPACRTRSISRAIGMGMPGIGAFKTSQQAYDTLHIGDPAQAAKLQSESRK